MFALKTSGKHLSSDRRSNDGWMEKNVLGALVKRCFCYFFKLRPWPHRMIIFPTDDRPRNTVQTMQCAYVNMI